MRFFTMTGFRGRTRGWRVLVSAALVLAVSAQPALAEHPATTLATLLDRAQIEDLLVDYYAELGAGRHEFASYYVEDGILDVNGLVAQGKKAIEDLYKQVAQGCGSAASEGHVPHDADEPEDRRQRQLSYGGCAVDGRSLRDGRVGSTVCGTGSRARRARQAQRQVADPASLHYE